MTRCEICGRRVGGEEGLMHHMEKEHSDPGYDCRRCGLVFSSMEEMRTHLQGSHRYDG
ncbi:MAG: hypothetical protein MPI95_03400 [Nitrosopumilus sp.]|nr:hypothetical protein [Nitrosopumilus sp.]CAI9831407.1 C2H2 Zn finger protein [Nitrosopumilaceae archaeon]MDA7940859.1 hypothetical protein [Nitrosopumilus sp.]MDA7943285.1 hypothetical protein [Nitrosopumilus sp.]MDA7944222.1 hypothetical protein [Nitrosopumilus sp.]